MSEPPGQEASIPPLHPGRASAQTLQLIDLVLSAPSPAQALHTLEEMREQLLARWEGDLSLDEAGRIDLVRAELDQVIADLRRMVEQRRPLPPPDEFPPDEPPGSGDLGGPESEGPVPEPPESQGQAGPDIFFLGRGVSGNLARRQSDVVRLQEHGLPVLADPRDVARALDLPVPRLRWLAFHTEATARSHYTQFRVPKRSGGTRTLSAPLPLLANAQRWILDAILARLPVEDPCHGFVPGRSTVTNAAVHAGQGVVVNLDLEDFFPSVGLRRVRSVFARAGSSEAVATVLALLCTECPRREVSFNGQRYFVATGPRCLPQGACTSPALANQVARKLDRRLAGLAAKLSWRYSRYADDLTFSAPEEGEKQVGYLLARVRHIALAEGFRINQKKTRIHRQNRAQVVTGLVVNKRPSVPRQELRRLRAILHRAASEGLAAQNREGLPHFRAWLLGKIAYVKMVNPALGAQLLAHFRALPGEQP